MVFKSRYFEELSTKELYAILKARSEIFVVGQNCIYQDMDGKDQESLHLFYEDEKGNVVAYLRIFKKADEEDTLQMGRVFSLRHGQGLGGMILHKGMEALKAFPGYKSLFIEAQCYATGFYEREGFVVSSEEFLEDGIPHVEMRRAI